jgi:hypothetical protein
MEGGKGFDRWHIHFANTAENEGIVTSWEEQHETGTVWRRIVCTMLLREVVVRSP